MSSLHLPLDTVFCIAEFLPIRHLPSFLGVCQDWHSMEQYEIFWKTILSHDIFSRLKSKIEECHDFPFSLAQLIAPKNSGKKKAKIPPGMKNNSMFLLTKASIERIAGFYQTHILHGKALSRQSFKKYVIRRESEEVEDEEMEDDMVFGTRFKYLTQQYINNVLPADLVSFFTQCSSYSQAMLGAIVLGFPTNEKPTININTIQHHLQWFKRISTSNTHHLQKSPIHLTCSEIFITTVMRFLIDKSDDVIEKEFSKFLTEYSPLLGWDSVFEAFRFDFTPTIIDTLTEYAKSDKFVNEDRKLKDGLTWFERIYKDRKNLEMFYNFITNIFSKDKWQEIIEIIGNAVYNNHYHNICYCNEDVMLFYIEIMQIKSLNIRDLIQYYNSSKRLPILWKEAKLISDEDLAFAFNRLQFDNFTDFKDIFDYCKMNVPSLDIYGWVDDCNWFYNTLRSYNSSFHVQDQLQLVLGSGKLDLDKLCIDDKRKDTVLDTISYFIVRMFFARVYYQSQEAKLTQQLLCLCDKFEPYIFTSKLFENTTITILNGHQRVYDFSFSKERAELLLSFFDFDGVNVEQYMSVLMSELDNFSITDYNDYQNYNEGSNERKLALYLGIRKHIDEFIEPHYEPEDKSMSSFF